MPVVYIYQTSDFVQGIPDEKGGAAQGRPPFKMTLKDDAKPVAIEINDDDGKFDEIDWTQTLGGDVTIDGVDYHEGDSINSAYHLSDTSSGLTVTSFHVGPYTSGYDQGPVQGLTSNQPLNPGETYSFNQEVSSYCRPLGYDKYTACFTKGTMIETPHGERPIETLCAGDKVVTRDHGSQELRWIGHRQVVAQGNLAPVVFMPGAIGNDRAVAVSPQHRMLITGPKCALMFGSNEVLVAAIHLVNADTIYREYSPDVWYYHLLFGQHEIVFANGSPSESFFPDSKAKGTFSGETAQELLALFPELHPVSSTIQLTARPVLKGFEAKLLVSP